MEHATTASHEHGHDSTHHVLPIAAYFAVFGALMVLTVVTVLVSYANLGPASIYVALAVAVVKAALVAGYFMHLKYDDRFNSIVFFGSLLFVAIFFGFTFIDLASRGNVIEEQDFFTYNREQALKKPAPAKPAAPAAARH